LSPTTATFLFEVVNFLLLAGLLGYFLFKPVRQSLERKRAAAEKSVSDAAAKLAEAERLRDEAKKERAALDGELQQLRKDALARAEQEAGDILSQARKAVQKEREAAKQALSGLSDAELARLAEAVADAAGKSVAMLLSKLDETALDRELVRAACRELRSSPAESRGTVVVETARPLEGDARREVEAELGDEARNAEFRVVPGLGAGIRITTRQGLVDASIGGLADYARRALGKALTEGEPG
jgi:F-type H+-transporting ATPase subunit b